MTRVVRQKPKAFETITVAMKELEGITEKVGWFKSAKYENGTPVAYIAAIQELGSPANSIPPRPFMRPTISNRSKAWSAIMQRGAKAILGGTTTPEQVMDQLGLRAAADVAQTITEIYSPPLSPITIELRARKLKGDVITGRTVGEAAAAIHAPGYIAPSVSTKPLIGVGQEGGYMLSQLTNLTEKAK